MSLPSAGSAKIQIHQTRIHFSIFQLSSFNEPVPTSASDICSWLTGLEPDVVVCCCSSSTSRFNVCSFLDGFLLTTLVKSSYLSYCSLSVSSNKFFHSPLTSLISPVFSSTKLPLTGCLFFFSSSYVNSRDCFVLNPLEINSFRNTHTSPSGNNNHFKSLRSVFVFPILVFDVNIC